MIRQIFSTESRNFYILITIVITLCIHISCTTRANPEINSSETSPQAISDALSKAETLFAMRETPAKLRDAVALLANIRNPHKRNFDVEWKFAKYSYFLGKAALNDEEAQAIFQKGRDAALIASRMEPKRPEGHFWYGANLGELSKRNPITVRLTSVDDIRSSMNTVIEIQPDYQGASAYDALAQVELNTRLYGGKAEKAVELLEKAIEIDKENANLRLTLAEAYLAVKKRAEAKLQLNHLFQLKQNPDYLKEHNEAVEKGKKLLGKLTTDH